MIRTGILWIFFTFLRQAAVDSHALTINHTCDTDYWHTITCSVQLPVTSRNKNASYWIEFVLNDLDSTTFTCPLYREHKVHSCFLEDHEFMDIDGFAVSLYHSENNLNKSYVCPAFIPAKNIKPCSPYNLTLQYANGKYHFSWENGYENHIYQTSLPFKYNFLYYKDRHLDNPTSVYITQSQKSIEINETHFDPDSEYIAMVRTGIDKNWNYEGKWSEWSTVKTWRTRYRDKPNQSKTIQRNGIIIVGTFVMLGLIVLLLFVPAARMKIKEIIWVPTPETYFQPLYTNSQGNFQGWVFAKSPLRDVHVLEEYSTVDKITEVQKLQYQAEKSDVYPPAQCHTPYVGPATELWVPSKMIDTCSETSLPCEDFTLFCEALPNKVDNLMQCLTTASFNEDELSLKASVLSLKSLESLGISELSETTVIVNPTPVCFKQDYCTLTDTLAGPVPTFTRDVEQNGDLSNELTPIQ